VPPSSISAISAVIIRLSSNLRLIAKRPDAWMTRLGTDCRDLRGIGNQ
jgi:hypothetical protein